MTKTTYREIGVEDPEATDYQPRPGDIVRIGSGRVEYAVSVVRDGGRLYMHSTSYGPTRNREIERADFGRLVLLRRVVTPEPTVQARVAAFVEAFTYGRPEGDDAVLRIGRMVDGKPAEFTLTITDLRTLLALAAR